MEISPKLAIWINVVVALLTLVASGGLSLSGIVSPTTAGQIVTGAGTALAVINAVMHAYSSSTPGPLAPPDAPVVVAAQKVADLPADASVGSVKATKAAATAAVADHQP